MSKASKKIAIISACSAVGLGCSIVRADDIAFWDLTNGISGYVPAPATSPVTSNDPGVTANGANVGPATSNGGGVFFYNPGYGLYFGAGGASGESAVVAGQQYIDITLPTVAAGDVLNLTQLDIWGGGDGAGAQYWTYAGVPGFSPTVGNSFSSGALGNSSTFASPTNSVPPTTTISLAGAQFQGITTGIDIRLYIDTSAVRAFFGGLELEGTVGPSGPPSATWTNGSTDGNWNTGGNWDSASVLTGQGAVANFTTSAAGSVSVNAAETVGKINIDSTATPYLFTAGGGSITFDDTGDAIVSPQINVNNGSHTINAPVILTTGLNVNFLNSSGLTVGGAITGTGPITVNGAGTLTVAATSGLLPSGSALSINTGALVALAASAHPLGSPAIQTIASIAFDGPSSKLDVGNNEVIDSTDSESVIRADIVAGNIYSSLTNFTYGVGEMPSGGGTEIRYTVIGDTNLDGVVNFTDLLNLASDYGMTGADWLQGDLNYDGTINFSDLLDLASNYGTSLTPGEATSNGISPSFAADWNLAVSEVSSVPEPTSIGLLAVGATGLLARRRRAFR